MPFRRIRSPSWRSPVTSRMQNVLQRDRGLNLGKPALPLRFFTHEKNPVNASSTRFNVHRPMFAGPAPWPCGSSARMTVRLLCWSRRTIGLRTSRKASRRSWIPAFYRRRCRSSRSSSSRCWAFDGRRFWRYVRITAPSWNIAGTGQDRSRPSSTPNDEEPAFPTKAPNEDGRHGDDIGRTGTIDVHLPPSQIRHASYGPVRAARLWRGGARPSRMATRQTIVSYTAWRRAPVGLPGRRPKIIGGAG